jgi:hypothetical protein
MWELQRVAIGESTEKSVSNDELPQDSGEELKANE